MTLLNTADAAFIADREAHRAYLGENEVFVNLEAAVRSFFANGEPGVWFDNAALDTLYEDSAGITPAVINGLVGLQRSKARNGATGATLAVASWTNDSWDTFTPAGNGFTASKDASGGTDAAYSNETIPVVLGRLYKIEFNVSAATAAQYLVLLSSAFNSRSTMPNLSGTGAKTCYVRANVLSGDFSVQIKTTSTGSISVDSVVVTEILDHYRYQDTTAFKPILRGTPTGPNLVTNGDFSAGTTGWSTTPFETFESPTTFQVAGGKLRVSSGPTTYGCLSTSVPTQVGRVYRLRFSLTANDRVDLRLGTFTGSTHILSAPSAQATDKPREHYFTATTATTFISFIVSTGVAPYAEFDDFEVYDVSADAVQAPYFLHYDGVDDYLVTNDIDFTGTDAFTVWGGLGPALASASGVPLELSTSVSSNNGTFAWILSFPSQNLQAVAKGTAQSVASKTALPVPGAYVVTQQADISADQNILRIDGVEESPSATDQGTGSLGNYPMFFGRRGGSAAPFKGYEYGYIVRGAASTAHQLADGNLLTAQRTGVTLP